MQSLSRPHPVLALLVIVASALSSTTSLAQSVVYTVNDPLAYFAERIGGDHVSVHFPAPKGVDPAFWRPDPEIVLAYQAADLILTNGAGYARWIARASLPRSRVVDTSRSFRSSYLRRERAATHQHGPDGAHQHGELASMTWLDPRQAISQARSVEAALSKLDPEGRVAFAERSAALVADLEQLDRNLSEALAPFAGEALIASHPVYGYLARRYGLDLRSLEWEPNEEPGPGGWHALDEMVAEQAPRWMLWEAEPLAPTRQRLATRGIGVLVFHVAGNRREAEDFLSTMQENAERLRSAASDQRPEQ